MTYKMSQRLVSVLFLVGSTVALGCNATASAADSSPAVKPTETSSVPTAAKSDVAVQDGVVVYYFHGDRRCPTCIGIQKAVEQTVAERFSAQQVAGALVYQDINMDDDVNKGYANRYQLASSTMIVSTMVAGKELKWTNCDKVWTHALDASKLTAYIEEQIRAGLAAAGK